ncbi:hypothetical protein KM043_002625 [Ampulex compressa]|nr:hypothetical protein KM043_002625 [Ampulex compressa]
MLRLERAPRLPHWVATVGGGPLGERGRAPIIFTGAPEAGRQQFGSFRRGSRTAVHSSTADSPSTVRTSSSFSLGCDEGHAVRGYELVHLVRALGIVVRFVPRRSDATGTLARNECGAKGRGVRR